LVIISQSKGRPWYSIRWRIALAYSLIFIVAFFIFYSAVSDVVEDYFVELTVQEHSREAELISVSASSALASGDADRLYSIVTQQQEQINGRILILDSHGVVQADSFSSMNGRCITNSVISDVIYNGMSVSYSVNDLFETTASSEPVKVLYCAAPVTDQAQIIGAAMLSISVQSVYSQIEYIERSLMLVSVATIIISLVIGIIMSGTIVRPIRSLTAGIERIGHGDFSQRVSISGKSEFAQLANTFNEMSQRLNTIDTARNKFVSNASHELKTPLTSIKVLADMLVNSPVDDPAFTKEILGDISKETERMAELINDLLTLVRLDEGTAIQHTAVSLSDVVNSILPALKSIAAGRSIIINHSVTEGIYVSGRRSALSEIVTNLIDNAIKYSNDNSVINVSLSTKGISSAIFTVKDNGIGIHEEDLPLIFERFYRVDKARSRTTGGTGLGLSIVKQLVAEHSGEINASSTFGKGTTMTVTLPTCPRPEESLQGDDNN